MIVNTARVVFVGVSPAGAARIVVHAEPFAAEHPEAWAEMQEYRVYPEPPPLEFNDVGGTAFFEFASLAQLQQLAAGHGLWAPDPPPEL